MHIDIDNAQAAIEAHITGELRHKHYDRVVDLADKYNKLITGEDIADLLEIYAPRETDEMFAQRKRLTQSVTQSISEKVRSKFFRVSRIDNIQNDVLFSGAPDTDKRGKLDDVLGRFYGNQSLMAYMNTRYIDLSFVDPNAFVLVDFAAFDHVSENAQPYPVEISSKEAINYHYENNNLEWLLQRTHVRFNGRDEDEQIVEQIGDKMTLYLHNDIITMTEIDPALLGGRTVGTVVIDGVEKDAKIVGGKRAFTIERSEPKGGRVQAVRVGYKQDLATRGKTFVSPLHPALPRMLSSLKIKSEYDLTMTLHTFPQKIQYSEACEGSSPQVACVKGKTRNGATCGMCGGSGKKVHTSSQDIMEFALPSDKEDMIDLDKIITYKHPPIDLVKFQQDTVEKLEHQSLMDVFTESASVSGGFKTALENALNQENIHDTLLPFTVHYSAVFEFLSEMSAVFIDLVDVDVIHRFPKDFKLKGVGELLDDLKSATDASAPVFVKSEIVRDIAGKLYADKPDQLRAFNTKMQHMPFQSKTEQEIAFARANGDLRKRDLILWANFEAIFQEIETENTDFYMLTNERQIVLIDAKIKEFSETLRSEELAAIQFVPVDGEG